MLEIIKKEISSLKNKIFYIVHKLKGQPLEESKQILVENKERVENKEEDSLPNEENSITSIIEKDAIRKEKTVREEDFKQKEELNKTSTLLAEDKKELHMASIEKSEKKVLPPKIQNLKFGDIISAKRYSTLEERKSLEEGHRTGPFIVVGKDQDSILAIYGTSKAPKEFVHLYYYFLDRVSGNQFTLTKDTYFQISKICHIREEQYVSSLGPLCEKEQNFISKQMKIARDRGCYRYLESISLPKTKAGFGDIVSYQNKVYFIFKENQDFLFGFELKMGNENSENRIYINKKYYILDYEKEIEIPKKHPLGQIRLVDLPSPNAIQGILEKRKKYLEEKEKQNECSRGTIIKNQDKIYYIYGEEGQEWLVFQVLDEKQNNTQCIRINTKEFYTRFSKKMTLSKKDAKNYTIVTKAKELEMDEIKKQKKSYEKIQAPNKKKRKKR